MKAWLVAYTDDRRPGTAFPLDGNMVGVGRGSDNLVQLKGRKVSKRHAVLRQVEGAWKIEDLDSSNGLFRNGKRITQAKLKHGDKLTFGDDQLTFELSEGGGTYQPAHVIDLSTQAQVPTLGPERKR